MTPSLPMRYSQGFTALLSTILVSAILLLLTVTISFESLLYRQSILIDEEKEITRSSARSCISFAIGVMADDRKGNFIAPITLEYVPCTITSIQNHNPEFSITAESELNEIDTHITAVIEFDASSTVSITSWEET